MALTGDLAQIHITDIIQLINSTRQSGTLSIKSDRGESRIIFSNGYMVGANHLNNRIRIGSVLVAMKAISASDLKSALDVQRKSGSNRKPLISTLKQMGKLQDDAAAKALRKLIEITIVDVIGWKDGTFSFDTDAIAVSPECSYHPGQMEQEQSFDAMMVLMDALRIFDERERDRMSGAKIPADEELYAEVLPSDETPMTETGHVITADILGLADLDQLENRIPEKVFLAEPFDPVEIHRKKVREFLYGFSKDGQDEFVAFLKKAMEAAPHDEPCRIHSARSKAIILLSSDELLTHSLMTVCRNEDVIVFGITEKAEIERVMCQCQKMKILPVLVIDAPDSSKTGFSEKDLSILRADIRVLYPSLPVIQTVSQEDYHYALCCIHECVRAVVPKPSLSAEKPRSIADMIMFIEALMTAAGCLFYDPGVAAVDGIKWMRDAALSLRMLEDGNNAPALLFDLVSGEFGRAVLFSIGSSGLSAEKTHGLKIGRGKDGKPKIVLPIGQYSVFDEILASGQAFFDECDDEVLNAQLFSRIGAPLKKKIFVLPIKVSGQVLALIYADSGSGNALPFSVDLFEILAIEAGLIMENSLYREQLLKIIKK